MPLNTYIEPTAGTSLNSARLQQNDNFRTLLTNFAGATAPTSSNLTVDGASLTVPDGLLYRDTTTGTLFITDSINKKGSYVGGNFTRWGIGTRVVNTIADVYNNRTKYEQGEFVGSLDTGYLYFRTSNTDANTSFVQIGAVSAYTVDAQSNVTFTGQRIEASRVYATNNVMLGTTAPAYSLHIVGTGYISGNVTLGANATVANKLGVGTTVPTSNLHTVGNAYISANTTIGGNAIVSGSVYVTGDVSSTSDIRIKENITKIDNALDKVLHLEGVYYNLIDNPDRRLGVIAQQVEQVIPEVVSNANEYKTVLYGNITGLLIEAIKELAYEVKIIKEVINVK
jgi:hypothetical protein